jgi:hypothetical protein
MTMRLTRSSSIALLSSLAALASACTDRTQPSSEVGRRLAEHLCPIQATCGCDEELLIPSCEARVEREFIASEREALAAGLDFDESCVDFTLAAIDSLATCGRPSLGPSCPVYTAHAEVGEACEIIDHVPVISHCRAGLTCIQGKCKDLDNPHLLYEGEVCSETQANLPTGDLGRCVEGLTCDSNDTRTCVPSLYWPPVPVGGVCTHPFICVDGSYCRPNDLDDPDAPNEGSPGICTLKAAEGQPCSYVLECELRCLDGFCEHWPPFLCGVLGGWWLREML